MLLILIIAFFASISCAILLVRFKHVHGRFSMDQDVTGVQKFHTTPVPRIGGVPVIIGFIATLICAMLKWHNIAVWLLLLSALPAFFAGLIEDLTKKVGPMPRLLATFVAAALGFWLLNAGLSRLSLPGIDYVLHQYWAFSLILTIVAVGGIAHALNIIDGYNGLASMVAMLIFLALAYVAYKVNDSILCGVSLGLVGAIGGFFVLNYPRGLIFFGDGGAYLVGFLVAEISVLLVMSHEKVSPWFPMLLVIYPVMETLFSIYRKKFIRKMSPGLPDGLHLHMLVYKRLVRWAIGSKETKDMLERNSLTSPYLWALASLSVVPACLFWDNTPILILFCCLFVMGYIWIYMMLIRFKTPKWLIIRKK
ncbi:MraY family glycosyltransferase [Neisseria sp. Ec49-e6-T10]|uniref:MraY family glycosyltransferase n=1 Tax=Neisseria sp. Ec49-e6-T10 TaxID=3140744 RepID=UPI003EB86B73